MRRLLRRHDKEQDRTVITTSKQQTRSAPRLVFGASGYIGSNLVPTLLDRGIPVRASARNARVLDARGWQGVEICEADALAPESLGPVLRDIDVAYYLVHSMAAGSDFGRIDLQAARNFARAAADAGVRRIVYLGGLVPPEAESEHIVSRAETGEVLRRGRVPVTEIRAGIIVGPGSAAFEVMRDLVLHLPLMITPRWVRSKSPPIALENLLDYLVRVAEIPEAEGQVFDVGGPETLTYQDMMRILAEMSGRRPPWIIPVPVLSPTLSSYWLKLVTAVPTPIARALIGGLKHDFAADDAEIRRLIPQRLLGFREAVEAVFEAERQSRVSARWTEGAFMFRDYRTDYAYYAKHVHASATSSASTASVWRVVSAIGGENRYYYLNSLWTLRELVDALAGGPGFTRGRRHPSELRVGDTIDSMRVIGVEPERRLTLGFGMKAPGSGVLEFEISPSEDGRTRITTTAYFHPAGARGLLYWYALLPLHRHVFTGLTRRICELAESSERVPSPGRARALPTDQTPPRA